MTKARHSGQGRRREPDSRYSRRASLTFGVHSKSYQSSGRWPVPPQLEDARGVRVRQSSALLIHGLKGLRLRPLAPLPAPASLLRKVGYIHSAAPTARCDCRDYKTAASIRRKRDCVRPDCEPGCAHAARRARICRHEHRHHRRDIRAGQSRARRSTHNACRRDI